MTDATSKRKVSRKKASRKKARKIGRPRKKIDLEKLKDLAGIGCTDPELALVFKCCVETIENRRRTDAKFRAAEREGWSDSKMSLRRSLFNIARDPGHAKQMTALIFLAKSVLGMSEIHKLEMTKPVKVEHSMALEDPERLVQVVDVLRTVGVLDQILASNGGSERPSIH